MSNLYWTVHFSTSGHIRLRHNDVIKFLLCIFVIYWYFAKYVRAMLGLPNKPKNELSRFFGVFWGISWPFSSNATNFPQITMQKELGRYLLPLFGKDTKLSATQKTYPPLNIFDLQQLKWRKSWNGETVPESIPEEPEMPLLKLLVGTSVWFEPQKHAKPKSAIQSSKFDLTKIFFDFISRWAIANFFVNVPWISILLIHFDVFIVSSLSKCQ